MNASGPAAYSHLGYRRAKKTSCADIDHMIWLSNLLITGKSAKLMPLVSPTWTIRGTAPAKKADGPSFLAICLKQSKVPEYNFLPCSPCMRDFTQSCGWVRTTEPQPAKNPAAPL